MDLHEVQDLQDVDSGSITLDKAEKVVPVMVTYSLQADKWQARGLAGSLNCLKS